MIKGRQYISIMAIILMAQGICFGQNNGLVEFSVKKFPFIHPERNEIVNAKVLDSLFAKLYALKTGNKGRVNILQIGDSHIQADFLSAQVRTDIQTNFGNAGRGIVVPLKVAGSNEPFNYRITSNVACDAKRCVFINDPMPIGIGGVTIKTSYENTTFHIRTFDYPPLNYAFNRVTLFYEKDSNAYDFWITDSLGNTLGNLRSTDSSAYSNTSSTVLKHYTNDMVLNAERRDSSQNNATLFALNLENDSSGVLYHSVGVNGAEAFQYVKAKYFAEETQVVHPDLIIISLGTNEAQRRPFDKELIRSQLDSLVRQVQAYNPNTPFLFTTPPDSYSRKKYYNPYVLQMHDIIVQYAKENKLTVWDLFSIAGGYKSCVYWRKYGLMRTDGIHFSRKGYEFQGNLFYEAFIKAYNKYVSGRPQ